MGYRTAELPDVKLDEFEGMPFFDRMKMLMLHWVDHGFGTPKQSITFYVWKIFLYGLFGLIVAGTFTKGLEFNDIGGWWHEPMLYQQFLRTQGS
jgi:hypothetical protein